MFTFLTLFLMTLYAVRIQASVQFNIVDAINSQCRDSKEFLQQKKKQKQKGNKQE